MLEKKVFIIPCSGIGKVFGSIGREATYIVVNELAKGKVELECLPLIVKGKQEVIEKLKASKIIVIDGCPLKCSYNNLIEQVGNVDVQIMTTNVVKENRDLKPEPSIIPIGKNTKVLSQKLAEQLAKKVDELLENEEEMN
ncbi:MAG: putative zinc-binding protein [Candidatus Thorarchaeota archaeon]